jgi:ATP-dependent protease ClpP protease subunit
MPSHVGGKAAVPRAIITLVLFLVSAFPARADLRIVSSPGGEVGSYLQLFAKVRESGQRVIIDGPCMSACTLVLSTIPEDRICITPHAVLGFHAPRRLDQQGRLSEAPDATRVIMATYPAGVRAWIERKGGLRQKPIFLSGRQLAALYPRCQ